MFPDFDFLMYFSLGYLAVLIVASTCVVVCVGGRHGWYPPHVGNRRTRPTRIVEEDDTM